MRNTRKPPRHPVDISEEAGVRYLHFGSDWVQGAMRIARPWSLELTDLQGRTVFREANITSDEYEFDRAAIPAGMYLYRVTQAGSNPVAGRIVLR